MAIYRTVHLSFWTDRKVLDEFTPEDKFFFLYLLTNPATNLCGCYEISERQVSLDTGYNVETVRRVIERLQNYLGVIRYDEKTKEILVLNWGRYNWTKSPKLVNAVWNSTKQIKSKEFYKYITNSIIEFTGRKLKTENTEAVNPVTEITVTENTEAVNPVTEITVTEITGSVNPVSDVCIGYRYGINEQNVDNSVDNSVDNLIEGLDPPSYTEFVSYCEESKLNVRARSVYFYLQHKNWLDAYGAPIFDWKGYLRTCSELNNQREATEKTV